MMAGPFFEVANAPPLVPFGECASCGRHEDPEITVFWPLDDEGRALCPECSGVQPTEGYDHWVVYKRAGEMQRMAGPYSPSEVEAARDYYASLGNIETAWILYAPGAP